MVERRNRDRAEAILGPVWYRRALAFASWRLQIVLGRLLPVLYALARPDPQSPNSTPSTRYPAEAPPATNSDSSARSASG